MPENRRTLLRETAAYAGHTGLNDHSMTTLHTRGHIAENGHNATRLGRRRNTGYVPGGEGCVRRWNAVARTFRCCRQLPYSCCQGASKFTHITPILVYRYNVLEFKNQCVFNAFR